MRWWFSPTPCSTPLRPTPRSLSASCDRTRRERYVEGVLHRTYGAASSVPVHRSFFRERLLERAKEVAEGLDPVEEYLVDQANLRGFHGAFSDRVDLGEIDDSLSLEDIVIGLLQPHAPADLRVLKLVTRILQSGQLDSDRLLFRAKRERALPTLAWLVELIPSPERTPPVIRIARALERSPPRDPRRPQLSYCAERLIHRGAR